MKQVVRYVATWLTAVVMGLTAPLQAAAAVDAGAGLSAAEMMRNTEIVRNTEMAQNTEMMWDTEPVRNTEPELIGGIGAERVAAAGNADPVSAGVSSGVPTDVSTESSVSGSANLSASFPPDPSTEGSASESASRSASESADSAADVPVAASTGQGPEISSPSAILMEASTGQVIYEKNADEPRSPASITKIMTLILIFDALESGKIKMTDQVVTSAYAKSMGGSQVFLEEGEVQTVETLIKCIVVASGNDASVAMAEYIAGDEASFVGMMNERAKQLGMTGTHFEDCCGLTESPAHLTTARDIAVMSRELINHYPQIHNYSTIWMDTITHVTKQGTKEFGLSNTNKLLKMATNFTVTGLKTGSTSIAKYCLSATAEKDGVRLIASIMAAPDYKVRFADAQTLLNYGYANCRLYEDKEPPALPMMPVDNGVEDEVALQYADPFSYLGMKGEDFNAVEKRLVLPPSLPAPVEPGQQAGQLEYWLGGERLGKVEILTDGTVPKAGFKDYWKKAMRVWLMQQFL